MKVRIIVAEELGKLDVEMIDSLKERMARDFIHFSRKTRIYLKVKRVLDVVCSFCGLILLLPVFLLVALATKLEEPEAPVLFTQERIGRKGIPFKLYKFRSMRTGAPELSSQEFSDAQNYITRVGRFIRNTSIDELPQLWNVLIGNMSLVGPRPLLVREREVHIMRFQYGIYQVRPGITGMAQTHGRDTMNDQDKVRWDREYVEQISFATDFRLLWRTFFKVVKKEGVVDQPQHRTALPDRETDGCDVTVVQIECAVNENKR